MKSRKYYVICLVSVVCAICADAVGKRYASNSVRARAKRLIVADAEKAMFEQEAKKALRMSRVAWTAGAFLALVSFVSWIISMKRKEPVWELIPGTFLFFYLLLQFVLV
jgi:hypothetical protein